MEHAEEAREVLDKVMDDVPPPASDPEGVLTLDVVDHGFTAASPSRRRTPPGSLIAAATCSAARKCTRTSAPSAHGRAPQPAPLHHAPTVWGTRSAAKGTDGASRTVVVVACRVSGVCLSASKSVRRHALSRLSV